MSCRRPQARRARGGGRGGGWAAFDVLHLLPELLDRRLQREADARELQIGGFRAERIRFTVQFLAEEVEAAPDVARFGEKRPGGGDMSVETVELLAHVGAGEKQRGLLREPILRKRRR